MKLPHSPEVAIKLAHGDPARLGEWVHKPTTLVAVLDAIEASDAPMALREIAALSGQTIQIVNRALSRLHGKGMVERWKIPMQRDGYDRRTRRALPGKTTKMLYVYVRRK